MNRALIWPLVNAAVLVVGFLAIVFTESNALMIGIIIVGFVAAVITVVEGITYYRAKSSLPLWYAASGLIAAGGFVSWLFSAMGDINVIGLFIAFVGVAGLLWFGYQRSVDPDRKPFEGLSELRRNESSTTDGEASSETDSSSRPDSSSELDSSSRPARSSSSAAGERSAAGEDRDK